MRKVLTATILAILILGCEKSADRFAKIDGKRIHILDRGTGETTVVFLTGLICPLEFFYTVQSQISKETRTFSYDRSGLGLSDILDTIRSFDHVVNELHAILKQENIKPPYVLVAHSYGGGIARQFYTQFPDQVAGFVFVDCANDEIFIDSLIQKKLLPEDSFGPDSLATAGERYEMNYTKRNFLSFKEPFKTNLPVHLLVASGKRVGLSDEMMSTKINTYKTFNKGAPQMKIIFTEHSGHHIQRDQPELVVKSIKEVLDEIRNSM